MKNLYKLVFVALSLCFIFFLTSCAETGGTIIVENRYSTDKEVSVYSDFSLSGFIFNYKDKYGPKTISAGGSAVFDVKSNAKYGIIWREGDIDEYKTVNVSDGDTIEVSIP